VTNTIQNGNSNVLVVTADGNVSINVSGVRPLEIFTPLGQTTTGIISATGTITAGNLNTSGTVSASGSITGGNIIGGNIIGNIISTAASVNGNINAGNVLVSGAASAGRALTVNTPIYGSSPTYAGTAGTPNAGVSAPSNIGNNPYAGKQLTSGPKQ
jgi:hypothetical protein